MNQELQAWGPAVNIFTSPPLQTGICTSLRTSALTHLLSSVFPLIHSRVGRLLPGLHNSILLYNSCLSLAISETLHLFISLPGMLFPLIPARLSCSPAVGAQGHLLQPSLSTMVRAVSPLLLLLWRFTHALVCLVLLGRGKFSPRCLILDIDLYLFLGPFGLLES